MSKTHGQKHFSKNSLREALATLGLTAKRMTLDGGTRVIALSNGEEFATWAAVQAKYGGLTQTDGGMGKHQNRAEATKFGKVAPEYIEKVT